MDIVISGDDIIKLKKVAEFARNLGLKVETNYSKEKTNLKSTEN